MAGPSILQHAQTSRSTASGNVTPASTPILGNLLVVFFGDQSTTGAGTISDNQGTPNTWTKWGAAGSSQSDGLSLWSAPITQTAAGFQVTWASATAAAAFIEVIEVQNQVGIDGTPLVNNDGNGSGTAMSLPVGVATYINDLALMAYCPNSSSAPTWGSPLAVLDSNNTALAEYVGSGTVLGSGSITLTVTQASSNRKAMGGLLVASGISAILMPSPPRLIFVMP